MRNRIKTFLPGILTGAVTFILCNSFITSVEKAGYQYYHYVGFPFNWLIIYTNDQRDSLFSLLFGGNEGVNVQILGVFFTVCLHIVIGLLVCLLAKWIRKKRRQNRVQHAESEQ